MSIAHRLTMLALIVIAIGLLYPGVTQPVFPFLTIVNGAADHTVLAFGATIDTEPGIQNLVPFGGADDTFVVPAGGATVAAVPADVFWVPPM